MSLSQHSPHFHHKNSYTLSLHKNSAELIQVYQGFLAKYPIIFIEDPCAEDDWDGFKAITKAVDIEVRAFVCVGGGGVHAVRCCQSFLLFLFLPAHTNNQTNTTNHRNPPTHKNNNPKTKKQTTI